MNCIDGKTIDNIIITMYTIYMNKWIIVAIVIVFVLMIASLWMAGLLEFMGLGGINIASEVFAPQSGTEGGTILSNNA